MKYLVHPVAKKTYSELSILIEHFSLKEKEHEQQKEEHESRNSNESFSQDSMSTSM